jgi:propanol-preferring alcohol dehydrogenase
MRAIQYIAKAAPLEEQSVADTAPAAGEIAIDIRACGICHSDGHYRAGFGNVAAPRTLGHEIAGVVAAVGDGVHDVRIGDRVGIHYLLPSGEMLGKERDGGYADWIIVPAANAVPVPDDVPLEHAAVMMCSTATAYHALRLGALQPGESVAILGFGGLGVSALELSLALGAGRVFALDRVEEKLALAESRGASRLRAGDEFDVALDFIGSGEVNAAALRALKPGGRLMIVALSESKIDFNPYRDLLAKERRIIGCSDHTRDELLDLMRLASERRIDIGRAISGTVPLEAGAINAVLDDLDRGTAKLRTVIVRK